MADATIVAWSPHEIAAARGAIREIFAAAFAMSPGEADAYIGNLDRHARYPGFRFLAALDPADARPLGFVYGYSSTPGQWFHDTIRPALGPALAAGWLDGAFEYTEFAVRPEAQGVGIGGKLHDAILADLPHRTAVLCTYDDPNGALPLYRKRGWQPLRAGYYFPDGTRPYVLMGRDLAQEGMQRQLD